MASAGSPRAVSSASSASAARRRLNGALDISLLSGYSPPSGDSYPILTFGSETGDFAVETGLYLGGGQGFSPTYSSSDLELVVISEEAGTTTTVTPSLNPSTYGQSVTFTATVSPAVSTSFTPTGTVTFYDGASALGSATLSGGTASYTTAALIAGSHSIIAQYSGDSNFSGSNSTAFTQTVNKDGTGTAVVSLLNPSTYGESLNLTATVTALAPGNGTPTGSVTFFDGSTSLGSITLTNGSAILTTSALAAGSHSITAAYGGDPNFTTSTSPAVDQGVNHDGTTTTLSSTSVNPSVYGQAVTFTATVAAAAPGSGTPTGTVSLYDGSTVLGSAGLSGGSASITTAALPVGSDPITASYSGDSNFTSSNAAAISQTVNQDASASVVIGVPYPSVLGEAVTFTATVTAAAPGSGTPTGTVAFYDGATELASRALTSGSAAFTTSTLALGTHAITAVYSGDGNFTGSTSPVFNQLVNEYRVYNGSQLFGLVRGIRPVGHLHGNGQCDRIRRRHPDRRRDLLRRFDRDRHHSAQRRVGGVHDVIPARGNTFDHGDVRWRFELRRQHLVRSLAGR